MPLELQLPEKLRRATITRSTKKEMFQMEQVIVPSQLQHHSRKSSSGHYRDNSQPMLKIMQRVQRFDLDLGVGSRRKMPFFLLVKHISMR